jgi:hypothetical protein
MRLKRNTHFWWQAWPAAAIRSMYASHARCSNKIFLEAECTRVQQVPPLSHSTLHLAEHTVHVFATTPSPHTQSCSQADISTTRQHSSPTCSSHTLESARIQTVLWLEYQLQIPTARKRPQECRATHTINPSAPGWLGTPEASGKTVQQAAMLSRDCLCTPTPTSPAAHTQTCFTSTHCCQLNCIAAAQR